MNQQRLAHSAHSVLHNLKPILIVLLLTRWFPPLDLLNSFQPPQLLNNLNIIRIYELQHILSLERINAMSPRQKYQGKMIRLTIEICILQMESTSENMLGPLLYRRTRMTHTQFSQSLSHSFRLDSGKELARLDEFVEQQYQDNKKKHKKLFSTTLNPDDTLMVFWQLVVLICILIYFLELPIAVTFSDDYRDRTRTGFFFQIINIPSLVVFAINIGVKMRTAYYDKGILIDKPSLIRKHYFVNYLVIDVIALAAVMIAEIKEINDSSIDSDTGNSATYSLLFYLKIIELYQIDKSINRSLQLHRRLKAIFNMSMLMFSILFLSSAYACIFFKISENYCQNFGTDVDKAEMCWIYDVKAEGLEISKQNWIVQYAYSLYWASTTMLTVGYGDITPKNRYEVTFDIVAEFTSCLVFAFSVNKIWEIKQELNEKKARHQKNWNVINRYMRDKSVKSSVKSKVNAYLAHFYRHQKLRETELQNQIISQLAPGLKEELYMESYGFIFKEFKVFLGFSEDLFLELVYKIAEIRYSQNQIIYEPTQEEHDFKISYIFKGEVEVYLPMRSRRITITKIPTGEIYGDYQFFSGLSANSVVEAECYCLVYAFKLSDWKQVVYELYDDFEKYCEIRDCAQFLHDLRPMRMSCLLCQSPTHIQQDCVTYKMFSEKIIRIKSYKSKENARDRFAQRRRFKHCEVTNKNYLKDIRAIQELIINKESGTDVLASISQQSLLEHSLGQNLITTQILEIQPYFGLEDRPRRRNPAQSVRRANSSNMQRLRDQLGLDFSLSPKQVRPIAANDAAQEPNEAAAFWLNITHVDLDQKQSYEFYFKQRNIENIIMQARMPNRASMARRTFNLHDMSSPW